MDWIVSRGAERNNGTMNGVTGDTGVNNVNCKANGIKRISRKICRNNCASFDNINKKCEFGYK